MDPSNPNDKINIYFTFVALKRLYSTPSDYDFFFASNYTLI